LGGGCWLALHMTQLHHRTPKVEPCVGWPKRAISVTLAGTTVPSLRHALSKQALPAPRAQRGLPCTPTNTTTADTHTHVHHGSQRPVDALGCCLPLGSLLCAIVRLYPRARTARNTVSDHAPCTHTPSHDPLQNHLELLISQRHVTCFTRWVAVQRVCA
jgi:hypothetical protein